MLAVSSSEDRDSNLDGEAGKARVLKVSGGAGGPNRIHLQYRRHEPLHDHGGTFCGAGDQYPSDLTQQLTIFAVAVLTSKGASGVQGASFIALVGTLSVIPTIPVAGMALILGIDRFLSMFRALVNMIGNGVATLVLARWEGEISRTALAEKLQRKSQAGIDA